MREYAVDWFSVGGNETDGNGTSTHLEAEKGEATILFLFASFVLGALVRYLLKSCNLPYTVVLFLLGACFGLITTFKHSLQIYTLMTRLNPQIILQMFLPVLIFESAFSMDAHMFLRAIWQCLVLAVPGLVICSVLTAVFAKNVLTAYDWTWTTALTFGTILSATDPVAVVALLKEVGISASLTILIEGESLLNDGSAIVIFEVLLGIMTSKEKTVKPGEIFVKFVQISLGGPVVGYIAGKIATACITRVYNDSIIEITITFTVAYLTYYVADIILGVSGVLAVVVLGVVISAEKSCISPEAEESVHNFWEMMSYLANTLIFIIVGIIITERAVQHMTGQDSFLIIATYMAATVFRVFMIGILSPLLKRLGYGLSWKYAVVLTWGGLRGAVGLALALMLSDNPSVDNATIADKILLQLSGIIVLTLVVNGTTMRFLLRMVGMHKVSQSSRCAMAHAVQHLRDVAMKSTRVQRMDKFEADANWLWVASHTFIRDPYSKDDDVDHALCSTVIPFRATKCPECEREHPVEPTEAEIREMKEEARLRVIKALKVCYHRQFELGLITRSSVRMLVSAADAASDHPGMFIDAKLLVRHMRVHPFYNVAVVMLLGDVEARDIRNNKEMNLRAYMILSGLLHSFMLVAEIFPILSMVENDSEKLLKKILQNLSDKLNIEAHSRMQESWLTDLFNETTGCRHKCLKVYKNPFFEPCIFCILIANIAPIVVVFTLDERAADFQTRISALIGVNVGFVVVYILEAAVKMIALGVERYFDNLWNIFDFFVVLTCVLDTIMDFTVFVYHWTEYKYINIIRVVRILRLIRMVRLAKVLLSTMVTFLNDHTSGQLYCVLDLGHGFISAQEEVVKKIDLLIDYPPIAAPAKKDAEESTLVLLKYLNDVQKRHPGIAIALKSHQAARRILNDVSTSLEEMKMEGLVDEKEYEKIKHEIEAKIKSILSATRYLPGNVQAEDLLKKVEWITSQSLLEKILHTFIVKDYKTGQIIHDKGKMPCAIQIITSGVVKITGRTEEIEGGVLPNTDSFLLFSSSGKFHDYLTVCQTLGMLGYLVGTPFVTSAVCETAVEVIYITYSVLKAAQFSIHDEPPLMYTMWRIVALKIAASVLAQQSRYRGVSIDRIKLQLEKAIIPDLRSADQLTIDPLIEDVILIQGMARDGLTGDLYKGPTYISSTIKSLIFPEDPEDRVILIMVLVARDNYVISPALDWSGRDSKIDRTILCLLHTIKRRQSASLVPTREQSFEPEVEIVEGMEEEEEVLPRPKGKRKKKAGAGTTQKK